MASKPINIGQPKRIFKITLADGSVENVQCDDAGISPTGDLVCMKSPVGILYSARWWRKCEPSPLAAVSGIAS